VSNLLFESIMQFDIGADNDVISFKQKLAKENGWSLGYAHRCFEEYKKFLYLAAVSGGQVSPSESIDQVWHLHLTYTHSYWQDLCGTVLGFQLHHIPTKGGADELNKYQTMYQSTLERYVEVFDELPPMDIWPSVSERFDPNQQFVRLNISNHWVIKKPSAHLFPIVMMPVFLAACMQGDEQLDIWFILKCILFGYLAIKIFQWLNSGGGKGGGGGGFGCGGGCSSGCGGGCGGS